MICIVSIPGGFLDGDHHKGRVAAISPGTRLRKDHAVVKANKANFVDVVPEGRTRDNSVRALSDWSEYRKNANGTFVEERDGMLRAKFGEFKRSIRWYRGTHVDRSLPEVRDYPAYFERI